MDARQPRLVQARSVHRVRQAGALRMLETARDSRGIRFVAGKLLAVGALHWLASRFYGGLGCILALHRVVPHFSDLTPLPSFGGEIDADFLRQILAYCRTQGIAIVSLDEVADRLAAARRRTT